MEERKCVICGKAFTSSRPAKLTCSDDCSVKRNREMTKIWYEENKSKPNDLKAAKASRAQTQINIDRESAEARKLGLTYGKLKQQQFLATAGSILNQDWAQELMNKNNRQP